MTARDGEHPDFVARFSPEFAFTAVGEEAHVVAEESGGLGRRVRRHAKTEPS
jgi:hypothetical protein